jgi:outer membrane immunogenic protein
MLRRPWRRSGSGCRPNVANSGSVFGNQAPTTGALSADGQNSAIFTPYAGCNLQLASPFVVGVEADVGWPGFQDVATAPNLQLNGLPVGAGGIAWTRTWDRLASFRGRVGYSVLPNVLLFGTGGVAQEHFIYSGTDAGGIATRSTSFSQTLNGLVVGGGVDWAFTNNWVVQLEYLHYYRFSGLPSSTVFFASPVFFYWGDVSATDFVRVGLSLKLP